MRSRPTGAQKKSRVRRRPGILPLDMHRQPTDESCGPTSLQAVYRFWGLDVSVGEVVRTVRSLDHDGLGRGTLAVHLGVDALRRGFEATLSTFNLNAFDPTWFDAHGRSDQETLSEKLREQAVVKGRENRKLGVATEAYLEFLALGGRIRFEDLTSRLISGHIQAGRPLLIGLSATYLYRAMREYGDEDTSDDIRGMPQGHFVVLHGYDPKKRVVHLADPLEDNPGFLSRNYTVPMSRLVPAIMLGVLTYDGNLLAIEPREEPDADASGGRKRP